MSKKKTGEGLSIIIVGCGKVGKTLVEVLGREGHEITVVDQDYEKLQQISGMFDVMTIKGNGASYGLLMEAGIEETDLLIAVTDSDELNLLCCTVAKQVADCAAIARVRTPDYSREISYLQDRLGLAMIINPEYESARETALILSLPSALEVKPFAHGQAEMIDFKVPANNVLAGKTIASINSLVSVDILVCAVERNGNVYIPGGDFVIDPGDVLSVVGARRFEKTFLHDIGIKAHPVKDCMIVGGGKAAFYLANQLISMGIQVKIIEQSKKRCEELSTMIPKAVIINGDGTNQDLLMEEGIEYAEAFVPLTGLDEENVMLTLFAKSVSGAKVITKINRVNFKDVVSNLDLGSIIYPQYITTDAIIAYVRATNESINNNNITTLYHMFDNRVEAIEFNVEEKSDCTDTPLAKLNIKNNLLISFINRDGKIIIPKGSDEIKVGDTVMIVTTNAKFTSIDDILA